MNLSNIRLLGFIYIAIAVILKISYEIVSDFEEEAANMLIIATGISGCGRKEYLKEWVKYCESRGKRIRVFHVGGMMMEHARQIGLSLNPDNILNASVDLLGAIRSAVFEKIINELSATNYDISVICVHALFFWEKYWMRAYDRYLSNFSPDLYLTFIDDYRNILRRLNARSQFKGQNYTDEEVLSWQNVEVEVTSGWAEFAGKKFFAVPTAQSPATLYKLAFHPEIEPVYVAMPISHLRNPEDREPINRFIERLNKYFTVFNPLSVEVVGAVEVKADRPITDTENTVNKQVVYRDLRWFVHFVDKVIPYWPAKIVSSPGVNVESHEGFAGTKDVWTVFLGSEASPFVVHDATRLFRSENEFFKFLDERYPGRRDLVW